MDNICRCMRDVNWSYAFVCRYILTPKLCLSFLSFRLFNIKLNVYTYRNDLIEYVYIYIYIYIYI